MASSARPTLADIAHLPPTVSIPEGARIIGTSRSGMYNAIRSGTVPSIKIGKRVLIPTTALLDLLGIAAPEPTDIHRIDNHKTPIDVP